MYRDYAISPELFHWESQNATSTTSEAGRRYLGQAGRRTHVVLFVRESPTDDHVAPRPGDAGGDVPRGQRGRVLIVTTVGPWKSTLRWACL